MKSTISKRFGFSILALTMMAFISTASAKSWRINHDSNKSPDFSSINEAMSSDLVQDGDVLYLDPGCTLSTPQTINKQVTIVGLGYSASGQTVAQLAYINGELTITAANTVVQGMVINATMHLKAPNILIERCSTQSIYVYAQNVTVRQCFIPGYPIEGRSDETSNNFTLENCVIYYGQGSGTVRTFLYANIINNFIECSSRYNYSGYYALNNIINSIIKNNIILTQGGRNYTLNNVTGTITNNIISGSTDPQEGNLMMDTDFVTAASTLLVNDYRLSENSPAKGFGENGVDCGPYGGLYPMVPGGLPKAYPYYTKFSVSPRAEDNKIKVSLNIKMQDE